jgi:hypothetical protein
MNNRYDGQNNTNENGVLTYYNSNNINNNENNNRI